MEAELKMEEKLFKMQTESAAAMHLMQTESAAAIKELLLSVLPKTSPFQKFWEQKAAITAMLAAGEIMNEVASQFMDKLNTELLNSHLI
jgi:hypothetical protein